MQIVPLKFEPIYCYRIWGGEKLKTLLLKEYDESSIGESWEISAVEGFETRVSEGPYAGKTLKELIRQFKGDLVGEKVYKEFETEFPLFRRGDSNTDNALNIADAVFTLMYLFAQGPTPTCLDAADANDDGTVDISDGIYILQNLFAHGPAIPSPYPDCGIDSTVDALGCVEYANCE